MPLKESVNLFTMVDFPVFGLPMIAMMGSRLAYTGKLLSDSGSSYLAIILSRKTMVVKMISVGGMSINIKITNSENNISP